MTRLGIVAGGQRAIAQWMARPHHRDEVVLKQRLGTQLGRRGGADHPGLEIQLAAAQGAALLVGFGQKVQPHPRRFGGEPAQQGGAEQFHQPLAGAQGEGAFQPRRVDLQPGAQHLLGFLHQPADLFAQQQRPGVGTRPRPARTSSGSPVVSRSLARARLMAEGLRPSRLAAPATLPSSSRASRVISRLRSGVLMCMPSSRWEQRGQLHHTRERAPSYGVQCIDKLQLVRLPPVHRPH